MCLVCCSGWLYLTLFTLCLALFGLSPVCVQASTQQKLPAGCESTQVQTNSSRRGIVLRCNERRIQEGLIWSEKSSHPCWNWDLGKYNQKPGAPGKSQPLLLLASFPSLATFGAFWLLLAASGCLWLCSSSVTFA